MILETIRLFPQIFLGVHFCCHHAQIQFSEISLIIHVALSIEPFLWNFLSKLSPIFSHFMLFILHVTTNTCSSTSIISDMGLGWKMYKLRKCANLLWNKYIFHALNPFFLILITFQNSEFWDTLYNNNNNNNSNNNNNNNNRPLVRRDKFLARNGNRWLANCTWSRRLKYDWTERRQEVCRLEEELDKDALCHQFCSTCTANALPRKLWMGLESSTSEGKLFKLWNMQMTLC